MYTHEYIEAVTIQSYVTKQVHIMNGTPLGVGFQTATQSNLARLLTYGSACIDVSLAAVLYRAICSDFAAQQTDRTAF